VQGKAYYDKGKQQQVDPMKVSAWLEDRKKQKEQKGQSKEQIKEGQSCKYIHLIEKDLCIDPG
jgi:replicative DNA helicase